MFFIVVLGLLIELYFTNKHKLNFYIHKGGFFPFFQSIFPSLKMGVFPLA